MFPSSFRKKNGESHGYLPVTSDGFAQEAGGWTCFSNFRVVHFEQTGEKIEGPELYQKSFQIYLDRYNLITANARANAQANAQANGTPPTARDVERFFGVGDFRSFALNKKLGRIFFFWPGQTHDFWASFDPKDPVSLTIHCGIDSSNRNHSACFLKNGELCNFSVGSGHGVVNENDNEEYASLEQAAYDIIYVDFVKMDEDGWTVRSVDFSDIECKHTFNGPRLCDMSKPALSLSGDAVYSSYCSKIVKIHCDGKVTDVCDLVYPVKCDPAQVAVIKMNDEEKIVYWYAGCKGPKIYMGEDHSLNKPNEEHSIVSKGKQVKKAHEVEKGHEVKKDQEAKKDIQIGPDRLIKKGNLTTADGVTHGAHPHEYVAVTTRAVFSFENFIVTVESFIEKHGFCVFVWDMSNMSKPVKCSQFFVGKYSDFMFDSERKELICFRHTMLYGFSCVILKVDELTDEHLVHCFPQFFGG